VIRWALWGLQAELHDKFHVWALIPSPSARSPPPQAARRRLAPSIRCLALSIRGRDRPALAWPWPQPPNPCLYLAVAWRRLYSSSPRPVPSCGQRGAAPGRSACVQLGKREGADFDADRMWQPEEEAAGDGGPAELYSSRVHRKSRWRWPA